MHVSNVDEFIDNILDDFAGYLNEDENFMKVQNSNNFVEYQMEINKILATYEATVDIKSISDVVSTDEGIAFIMELVKKYMGYYMFIHLGVTHKGKKSDFINRVLEFTKLQSNFPFKIQNFFNSESNFNVISSTDTIKSILLVTELDFNKFDSYELNALYKPGIEFGKIASMQVLASFKLENFDNDKSVQLYNIIKLFILYEFYFKSDKTELYTLIEESQKVGEYIFIDIVVPKKELIDFGAIENVLTQKQIKEGLADKFYNMILETDEPVSTNLTSDEKIISLVNKKILVPISDDILLYHKDTEKYEKFTVNANNKNKYRNDTKLKYIIDKLDSATDLHSESIANMPELKKNIEKLFYLPLINRNAVLINNNEEIQIINKFYNLSSISAENSDALEDLANFRKYVYVNFKELDRPGLTIVPNKTIDVIRGINFNEDNRRRIVEMRTATDTPMNVIGFVLNAYNIIECMSVNDFVDIRKSDYIIDKNGYDAVYKYILSKITQNKKDDLTYYWFFDVENDKANISQYEQYGKMNKQEAIKIMISNIFDDVVNIIYDHLNGIIDRIASISQHDFYKITNFLEQKFIPFKNNDAQYTNILSKLLYEKYVKGDPSYDIKEDEFPGLDKKAIKLPKNPSKNKNDKPNLKIDLVKEEEKKSQSSSQEIIKYGAICQHNITWDNINSESEKKFAEKFIDFVYKYVVENDEGDSICRSCGIQINLKKYVLDGTFNDEGYFEVFNTPHEKSLDNIPEYDKYRQIIRNIDKYIDKISNIANMYVLQEKSLKHKNQIKVRVIKDCIDLIVAHNKNMKSGYKKRSQRVKTDYGITDSYLYIFELENDIFKTSSKDKDIYKIFKRDNIMTYALFLCILEITDNQVLYMGGDKLCNYDSYDKFGTRLMRDLKIITNNKKVTMNLIEYPVLAYILFYVSCSIAKYNIFQTKDSATVVTTGAKRFNPEVQKIIIHTLIDIVNSILEIYCDNDKKEGLHYLYNMLSVRFFQKLSTTYKNEELINKIKSIHEDRTKIVGERTKYSRSKVIAVPLNPIPNGSLSYMGVKDFSRCDSARKIFESRKAVDTNVYTINKYTNCKSGKFHKWDTKRICTLCGVNVNSVENIDEIEINKKFKRVKLEEKYRIYCLSGSKHKLYYDNIDKVVKCSLCDYNDSKKIEDNKLMELEKNLLNIKRINKEKELAFVDEELEYDMNFVKEISKDGNKSSISILIDLIEQNTSKNLKINDKNLYIDDDVYIIDHDHRGFKLDTPFIIKSSEQKILVKKNHGHYKKDVIYYINKNLNIEVFYDNVTYFLIGYKEANKNYEVPDHSNAYLKVNYSIRNKLRYLGCETKYVNTSTYKDKYEKEYSYMDNSELKNNIITNNIIQHVSKVRIINLKKCIVDIQKFVYRIKYNYEEPAFYDMGELFNTSFTTKYKNKLTTLKVKDNTSPFFNKWETVKYAIFYKPIPNKTINIDSSDNFYDIDDIINYDSSGNVILEYIVNEMIKLININDDKFTKNLICFMLIDIIDTLHTTFNKEFELKTFDLRKFKYLMESKTYIDESNSFDIDDSYDESRINMNQTEESLNDEMESKYSDQEELDAIDVDGEIDYEVDYSTGVSF